MMTGFDRLKQVFLDLVFPPRCVSCHREGDYLCSDCQSRVLLITPPVCDLCGRPVSRQGVCVSCCERFPAYAGIRSVARFEGPLRDAIHAFKYNGLAVLDDVLGQIMIAGWEQLRPPGDVIVPVPLHARRIRERGYNQSLLLAKRLSQHTGMPVLGDALSRVKETQPQVGLDASQRQINVAGAFHANGDGVAGRAVLLVDDVCTTGATISACAETLRSQDPISIWALTLARP